MPKLAKNMYTTAKGERKLNCYVVNIPKEVVEKTNLKDMQELEKETGRQYFNTQLFAIRVKEIYKILKEENDVNESN